MLVVEEPVVATGVEESSVAALECPSEHSAEAEADRLAVVMVEEEWHPERRMVLKELAVVAERPLASEVEVAPSVVEAS